MRGLRGSKGRGEMNVGKASSTREVEAEDNFNERF
jgi:hypothetical protein